MANWIQRFLNAIAAHRANAAAHHTKYTNAEAQAQAAALIAIHTAIAAAHHTKYTNAEAQAQAAALIAIHTAIAAAHHTPAGIPSGLITMWHGTIGNIPAGWVLCDGGSSTPNLLTRFVEGVASAVTNPGATGGSTSKTIPSHKLTIAEMPSHRHELADWYKSSIYSGNAIERRSRSTTKEVTNYVGGGGSHGHGSISDIRPKFYDVAFIMKT
ncbi:hypothetical protein ES707_20985 [subsurface metagenome]